MGKVKPLIDRIMEFDSYSDEEDIYAKMPWSPDSPSIILERPETPDIPEEAISEGMSYFIAAFIAREFLKDWVEMQNYESSFQEQCERLIQYAIHDA